LANKEKKTLELKVFGNSIKVVTDEDEEYVYKIVSYLNKKMEDVARNIKIASNAEKMSLVALSITDEYFKLKSSKKETKGMDVNFTNIISMIDNALNT
jgi:cell division protein ZapA (FtsZ GTPase activity inhibitor)